jgi:two-component system, chemotaxis family, chemotaxis protein CheY
LTASLERVRFLIVDDNVHMLNIVKTILRGFGAVHVFEAKDLAAAMTRLREDAIDIIVLDYLMGAEDGVAFLQQLRTASDSPAPYTPVIMLTAHAERMRVEAARDAGVSEFCTKPVTAGELIRKVGAVIDNPRPFVRSGSYFGPDRRRRGDPDYEGDERRSDRPENGGPSPSKPRPGG